MSLKKPSDPSANPQPLRDELVLPDASDFASKCLKSRDEIEFLSPSWHINPEEEKQIEATEKSPEFMQIRSILMDKSKPKERRLAEAEALAQKFNARHGLRVTGSDQNTVMKIGYRDNEFLLYVALDAENFSATSLLVIESPNK